MSEGPASADPAAQRTFTREAFADLQARRRGASSPGWLATVAFGASHPIGKTAVELAHVDRRAVSFDDAAISAV